MISLNKAGNIFRLCFLSIIPKVCVAILNDTRKTRKNLWRTSLVSHGSIETFDLSRSHRQGSADFNSGGHQHNGMEGDIPDG